MYWWLLPLFTAVSSWISFRVIIYFLFYPAAPIKIGSWKIHGNIPKHIQTWTNEITEIAVNALVADKRISQYLSDPSTLQPMMPFIETHIDDFLRHKLGKAMPVVSMFVGDRTINQMKSVFMKELETLLPVVIRRFLEESLHPEKLRPLIHREIIQLRKHRAFIALQDKLKHQLAYIAWFAAAIGLGTGLILSAIVYSINIF